MWLLDDGVLTVNPQPEPAIDFHLAGAPVALLLLFWNRLSAQRALLSGQLVGWGRRPMLGLKLRSLMRNP